MNTILLNTVGLDGDVVIKKGGGGGVSAKESNDVNFIDYDGTILYSYTRGEFLALRDMPALPEHKGLICQGWNYSFTNAQEYVRAVGILNVGAMYITDDGKTRLYISIASEGRMTVPLYFSQTIANGVTIDWGDGSATQTWSGTGTIKTSHTYSAIGDYIITLKVTSGILGFGNTNTNDCVMGSTGNNNNVYSNMLQKVELGNSVTSIGKYAFEECYSLSSVTLPSGITSIGNNAFNKCYSLASVTIPSGVTSIGNYAVSDCHTLSSITLPSSVTSIGTYGVCACYALASITLPSGITSIGNYAFSNNPSLSIIKIPSGVASFGNYAFSNNYGVAVYDFTRHTSVPTLKSTDAFYNIPSDCIIKVPASLLDSWKGATNWSTYASKIVAG